MGERIDAEATQLGVYIRQWRMVLSLTAAQVADRAGVGRDTLRKLENGDPTVGLGITLAVLKVLGQAGRMVAFIDPLTTDVGRARAAVLHRRRTPMPAPLPHPEPGPGPGGPSA